MLELIEQLVKDIHDIVFLFFPNKSDLAKAVKPASKK